MKSSSETPLICSTGCNCEMLLCKHAAEWRLDNKTHLISLPHVAVQDPSHALDGRMLQLMSSAHIVIDAPV